MTLDFEKLLIKDLIEFLPEKGEISLFGDRMLLFREDALVKLWNRIFLQVGLDLGHSIISKFGYECGYGDFMTISKKFPHLSPSEILSLGPRMHTHEGLVHVTPIESRIDLKNQKFFYRGEWKNSFEANIYHSNSNGVNSNVPVCYALTGYASGWCTAFAGFDVIAYETACKGQGHDCCSWEIRPIKECGAYEQRWINLLRNDPASIHATLQKKNQELEEKISDLNQARELVLAKEKRFKNLVENISDWIWEFDTDCIFTYVSPAVKRILGYEVEELLGKSAFDIIPLEEASKVKAEFEPIAKAKIPFSNLINVNRHKDGHLVILESSGVPIYDSNNDFKGYRGIDRDVTEREEQKMALALEKERAEHANIAKSNFLAIMSHEIRTPMNSILGMAQLILDKDISSQELDAYAAIILKNGKALKNLLDDIIDLTKIEAKKVELESTPFNVVEIISDVVNSCRLLLKDKSLTLDFFYEGVTRPVRLGDATRIRQVILNLINNAIKFTPEGKIIISVREKSEDVMSFEITDEGIGIEEDKIEKIFEIFTQADYTITRKYGGSGIGLSLSKELIELMGGQIHVMSKAGIGSTFGFTIPLPVGTLPKMRERDTSIEDLKRAAPQKILLVEDSEDNIALMRAFLRNFPFEIETATNGAQAIDLFATKKWDLVLMDLQMPIMDGLTATKEIRAIEQRKRISRTPIIAVSAHAFRDDREKSLQAGCDEHLNKPIAKEILYSLLYKFFCSAKRL